MANYFFKGPEDGWLARKLVGWVPGQREKPARQREIEQGTQSREGWYLGVEHQEERVVWRGLGPPL